MNNTKSVKLYNILLPLWLLVFLPSYLWLILIPANYLIDRIVLRWSLGDMPDKGLFCRKHNWKICIAGFMSDFAGALLLFGAAMLCAAGGEKGISLLDDAAGSIMMNPFGNVLAFLVTAAAAALSGVCIYFLDKFILSKAGLDPGQVRRSAIRLALITAPYLFFFPTQFIY